MSFEINPVLAGTFDKPEYAAQNAVQSTDSTAATAVDSRRYTQFDRSITDAGSTTDFSFSDLLDTLNPLEHIPVVSSIYRAITGDPIHPVARVAGDIIFGGFLGGVSALLGGVGALADVGLEAQTGKDSGGLVLAALFGSDDDKNPVQLADAGTAAPNGDQTPASKKIELSQTASPSPMLAALSVPAAPASVSASSDSAAPANDVPLVTPAPTVASNPAPALPSSAPAPIADNAATPVAAPAIKLASMTNAAAPAATAAAPLFPQQGAIPLANAKSKNDKQPFGGVMATANGNKQAEDMAIALSEGSPAMRLGHTIYTNKLMNGRHPLPPMLSNGSGSGNGNSSNAAVTTPPPTLPAPPAAASASVEQATTAAVGQAAVSQSYNAPINSFTPQIMQDLMLKAIGQYGTMSAGAATGRTLDLVN